MNGETRKAYNLCMNKNTVTMVLRGDFTMKQVILNL